jgi:hypothetical protein
MSEARYAVYFVPAAETELYRFGSSVIGYDCYRAANVPYLSELVSGIPAWDELTREPRPYGFHATLKAPFRLNPDACERDLCATLDRLAAGVDGAPIFPPRVDLIDRFVAIVPDHMPLALSDLADACVRTFEPFRASLSERERERRLAAGLDSAQIANLDQWGYPYVFSDFRFHMTLTGRLPTEQVDDLLERLRRLLDQAIGTRPIVVDRLALLRQGSPGEAFEVVRVAPVGIAVRESEDQSPR